MYFYGYVLMFMLNYKDEGEEEGFTIEVDSAQFNYPHIFFFYQIDTCQNI